MFTCALSVSSCRVWLFGLWSSPTLYSDSANAASPTPVVALSSAALRNAAFRASFAASAAARSRAYADGASNDTDNGSSSSAARRWSFAGGAEEGTRAQCVVALTLRRPCACVSKEKTKVALR